jgi:hypothetical protein
MRVREFSDHQVLCCIPATANDGGLDAEALENLRIVVRSGMNSSVYALCRRA